MSLTGGAALQLKSNVRFQFETFKPKAPKVGRGALLREPVRSGLRVLGKVFGQHRNPCWLGFDLCQVFRSAGRGLTRVGYFAARDRISVLAVARRSRAGAAPGWPRSTGAGKAARGDARGRRCGRSAVRRGLNWPAHGGGGAAAPPRRRDTAAARRSPGRAGASSALRAADRRLSPARMVGASSFPTGLGRAAKGAGAVGSEEPRYRGGCGMEAAALCSRSDAAHCFGRRWSAGEDGPFWGGNGGYR